MCKISGSRNKRPDKTHETPAPTQRKKVKSSKWEQTGPSEGGLVDPELIPLYDGHVAGPIWCGQDRGLLKSQSRCMELFDVATDPRSRLPSSDRAACYIQYLLGSSLFTDKIGNIAPSKLWPLVKDVRSSGVCFGCCDTCL
ncbi:hypothetical protein M9H77_12844 [Catharanthus roseus]|uniref:Uncharacterized protein n=1 Tax=Catharanthus roseus TaxID=4058 RepID=A0ACC0BIM6_CATRO|nr:hypothetical protein M9H77_12844 [Catharanthus roseus]